MAKAMASSAAEWKHVSVFISIFWLTSVVSIAFTQHIELKIWSSGTAQCGENMTLFCNASSSRTMSIKTFLWVRNTNICEFENNKTGLKERCERKNETSLILNLNNIKQDEEGEYICKLRAKEGTKEENFTVTVQPCPITSQLLPATTTSHGNDSSGTLVLSTCVVVGIVMVNLMMYC